ncbi:MAG: hypothetical protein KIT19_07885 [Phycisphaeraceae bacterium]|nr:hypothetical protein [Phycisphaeraceae bacterium]
MIESKDAIRSEAATVTEARMDAPFQHRLLDIPQDSTVPSRSFFASPDERYFAMISLGAIVDFHTLICPMIRRLGLRAPCSMRDTVTSASDLESLKTSLESIVRLVSQHVSGEAALLCFEHGNHPYSDCSGACGTAFPHLHVLPLAGTVSAVPHRVADRVLRETQRLYEQQMEYNGLAEFYGSRRGLGEYLMVSDGLWHGGRTIAVWSGDDRSFPSQIVRRIVQMVLGMRVNRWQDDLKLDGAVEQARKLNQAVASKNVESDSPSRTLSLRV